MTKVELVTVTATDKNTHQKTGTTITCTQEMADHLVKNGMADNSTPKKEKK